MQRVTFVCLMILLPAATCLAQQRSPVRQMKRTPRVPPLRGEQKLRHLVNQLDLSSEDREFVEGLFEVYRDQVEAQQAKQEQEGDLLERVRVLYAQMEEAEKAGDNARAEQLREQMKTLGPGVSAEREFLEGLSSILSDEQKAVLERAQQRLQRVPDGSLRPIDILLVAQGLDLSGAQWGKLSKVLQDFRAEVKAPSDKLPQERPDMVLARIIQGIREILTPEQVGRFDHRIERLRPAAVPTPEQGEAGPGEPEEAQEEPEGEQSP